MPYVWRTRRTDGRIRLNYQVKGEPLTDFIGTTRLPLTEWEALKVRVIQGGKHIIDLRGRSSFQSPAYLSIEMIAAAMGGQPFRWPAGTYVSNGKFDHIMMAMETSITKDGVTYKEVAGSPSEQEELEKSYEHLCKLRDEVIEMVSSGNQRLAFFESQY